MNRISMFGMIAVWFAGAVNLHAQVDGPQEWDIPWTYVGDSTATPQRNSKLVLTGKVTNVETEAPIAGALISADFLKYYDYSDERGNYALELPPGDYRIKVKQLGMLPVYRKVRIFSNGVVHFEMQEGVIQLDSVLITSRPLDSNVKDAYGGRTRMSVAEVRALPTLTGELDVLKTLQLLPGVSGIAEGSAGMSVRGGRVDQNLVLFNDVPLFSTAHALGFLPAFNEDVIDRFTLYKGNVPAHLGGRASSVIEINTRRGNFDHWQFQGGASPVSSRFAVEGPLKKETSSILVAGRLSHANWLLAKVEDPDVSRSRVSFNDAFVGLSHRFNANSTGDLTVYSSRDFFRFAHDFGYRWSNHVINARWQSYTDRKASPTLSVSYGDFSTQLFQPEGAEAMAIENRMQYFQLKETVDYVPNEDHAIHAGAVAILYAPGNEYRSGYGSNQSVQPREAGKSGGVEWALFVNDDIEVSEKVSVSAGMRYSHFLGLGPDTTYQYAPGEARSVATITDTTVYAAAAPIDGFGGLEPRLSVRVNLSANKSVKGSYNRMRQFIHLVSNSNAPAPVDLWHVSTRHLPPQVADNYSLGYFQNIKDNRWETSVEIFYKTMKNLVEYKDFPELFLNDHPETELLPGEGRARGLEIFARRLKGKWTGWLSYTYSVSEVRVASPLEGGTVNDGEWYPANYNKPHNVRLVINKHLLRESNFSLQFSYNTGRPFTAVESSYLAGGTLIPVYSQRNQYNIPDYFRVDISLTMGNIIRKFDDSLVFSIYNLFGRDNAYAVFYKRPAANFFVPRPYKFSMLGAAFPSLTYNFKF